MAILNTNDKDATAGEISLTTETMITLYVFAKDGGSGKYRIVKEVSPDDSGPVWVEVGPTLSRPGISTCPCVAKRARARVLETQGDVSTVTVTLLAR